MFSQHAKWLKTCNELPWRQDIASLNYILSSNVWQQDHNGFTHQDPGFLDHVANKKADVVRMYLPPDANCLLSCFNHCIASRNYVNVLVTSKHPRPQWLTMEQAVKHCTQGIGIWQWASNDQGQEPDVVLACCGDTPTLETLATVTILRHHFPDLKVRVINVVDLMRLQSNTQHPHGLSDSQYDMLFTQDKPILFTFHGYPSLIHELTYRRKNKNLHVRGYIEEGTITTPFDMRVLNNLDRFHLTMDVIHLLPEKLGTGALSSSSSCRTSWWSTSSILPNTDRTCRRSGTGSGTTETATTTHNFLPFFCKKTSSPPVRIPLTGGLFPLISLFCIVILHFLDKGFCNPLGCNFSCAMLS